MLDLLAHWDFAPGASIGLRVANLADRRYWSAGALPLLPGNSSTVDRYTAPGRNVSINFAVEW